MEGSADRDLVIGQKGNIGPDKGRLQHLRIAKVETHRPLCHRGFAFWRQAEHDDRLPASKTFGIPVISEFICFHHSGVSHRVQVTAASSRLKRKAFGDFISVTQSCIQGYSMLYETMVKISCME